MNKESFNNHSDYFYHFLYSNSSINGLWFEFRIPLHSFALIIKIESDVFKIEIGNNSKWWLFKKQGFRYSFIDSLSFKKKSVVRKFKIFLEKHNIQLQKDMKLEWNLCENPNIIIPKAEIDVVTSLASQIATNIFNFKDIEKLIVNRIEPYMRAGNA